MSNVSYLLAFYVRTLAESTIRSAPSLGHHKTDLSLMVRQLVAAGGTAYFQLIGRDSFGNLANLSHELSLGVIEYIHGEALLNDNAAPVSPSSLEGRGGGLIVLQQSAAPPTADVSGFNAPCCSNACGPSVHLVASYTRAGVVRADVGILKSGGLMATYYVGDLYGQHRHHVSRVDLDPSALDASLAGFDFAGNLSFSWPWRSFLPRPISPEYSTVETASVEASSSGSGESLVQSTGWRAWSPEALCDCSVGGCCSPSFSVRWAGWWRPGTQGPCFNMTAVLRCPGDRLRLWLDTTLLIDQWHSLSSFSPALRATRQLQPGGAVLYSLKVEYKHMIGDQGLKLAWANCSDSRASASGAQVLSAQNGSLLWLARVPGPQTGVTARIHPASPAASTSTVRGDGITLTTAGVSSRFRLTVRDVWHNLAVAPANLAHPGAQARDTSVDASEEGRQAPALAPFAILVQPAEGSTTPVSLLPVLVSVQGEPTEAQDGRGAVWSANSGHVTRAGLHNMHVSLVSCALGLSATYYNHSNLTR